MICVMLYWVMDTMFPLFSDHDYFRLLNVGQPILNSKGFLLLPCISIPDFPPQYTQITLFVICQMLYVIVLIQCGRAQKHIDHNIARSHRVDSSIKVKL